MIVWFFPSFFKTVKYLQSSNLLYGSSTQSLSPVSLEKKTLYNFLPWLFEQLGMYFRETSKCTFLDVRMRKIKLNELVHWMSRNPLGLDTTRWWTMLFVVVTTVQEQQKSTWGNVCQFYGLQKDVPQIKPLHKVFLNDTAKCWSI